MSLRHRALGRTLTEVLTSALLFSVMLALAIPGGAALIFANRRIEGQALLLEAAKRQRTHLLYKYRFARHPGELRYALPAVSRNGHYRLQVVFADQGRYRMRALPRYAQRGDRCGYLEINQVGRKTAEHGGADCWD